MKNASLATWCLWIGVAIVAITHVYMLVASLPTSQMMGHAIINLVAAALIAYGGMKK